MRSFLCVIVVELFNTNSIFKIIKRYESMTDTVTLVTKQFNITLKGELNKIVLSLAQCYALALLDESMFRFKSKGGHTQK